ncbi:MAG: ornithine carbamoyltransferase [Elusimicrobia bacterium]|nr:ornithine carbamoyltransferase [Elusimicrobiota bacterium]MBP9127599.1 ornithine carbamoyltransferase [Elusimicrobiota bacterium]MBP9699213.1 ornithine carbamoyltransferase [Elusimicrobiota bacterium]
MICKDFLSMADLTADEIAALLADAARLKKNRRPSETLAGKSLGMIFQKPSTRTAVSFAVAMYELGGMALTLSEQQLQLKRGETLADTARTLSRYLSGIMIRAHRHDDVEVLARYADVPVINGLTDREHPCQVLADLLTVMEGFHLKNVAGLKKLSIAYVGDGNNMAQSWLLASALLGLELTVASPKGYAPAVGVQRQAAALSARSGGRIRCVVDPLDAVAGAHVVYTDVWTSMGQESEAVQRRKIFRPYQVNDALLKRADRRAIVLHCLPAHRDEEITAGVLEGPQSMVFQQAENRLHVQKAVLTKFLACRPG